MWYLGTEGNISSVTALKNIHELVSQNLNRAHERCDSPCPVPPSKLQPSYSASITNHTAGPFAPFYIDDYWIVAFKENQMDVMPSTGGKMRTTFISDVKYILPPDNIISKISDLQMFDRKVKLRLNPNYIQGFGWQLVTSVNTNFSLTNDLQMYDKSQMKTSCSNTTFTNETTITASPYNLWKKKVMLQVWNGYENFFIISAIVSTECLHYWT